MALAPLVLSQLGPDGLVGKDVYRCAGRCSDWLASQGARPKNHGMFMVPAGSAKVACLECGALATQQQGNTANTDSSDDFVDAKPYVGNGATSRVFEPNGP